MRIRLTGTHAECQDLLAVLPDLLAEVAEIRQLTPWTPVNQGPYRAMTELNGGGLDSSADHEAGGRSHEHRGRVHLHVRPTGPDRTRHDHDVTSDQGASR
jgi:hypothetical protein